MSAFDFSATKSSLQPNLSETQIGDPGIGQLWCGLVRVHLVEFAFCWLLVVHQPYRQTDSMLKATVSVASVTLA